MIPNIILNPGFCETDGQTTAPRTVIFGGDDSDDSCESESDHEPRMEKFKRKLSVFFTDPTIYRSHIWVDDEEESTKQKVILSKFLCYFNF